MAHVMCSRFCGTATEGESRPEAQHPIIEAGSPNTPIGTIWGYWGILGTWLLFSRLMAGLRLARTVRAPDLKWGAWCRLGVRLKDRPQKKRLRKSVLEGIFQHMLHDFFFPNVVNTKILPCSFCEGGFLAMAFKCKDLTCHCPSKGFADLQLGTLERQ